MKAENIQSNASAPLLAGRAFGTFHSEQEQAIVMRLLKDAKGLHTAQDLKDYVTGYKETLIQAMHRRTRWPTWSA